MTTRAGREVTFQVGAHGRSVNEVAADLGCVWHTVMDAVCQFGEPLINDPNRIGTVRAVGLDETLFARIGPFRTQSWSTQIVDVQAGQLLDVVEGRDATGATKWFANRDPVWCARIRWATLDLSAYRTAYDTALPDATQVADPFHVVGLANTSLDECRRRVQNQTLGHRGRKHDPLYRCRRRLTIAAERLSADQTERMLGLLRSGDPHQTSPTPRCHPKFDDSAAPSNAGPPDPRLAPLPRHQRTDRSSQQPRETHQTLRVRAHQLPAPPNPMPPLRQQTRLGTPAHDPTLKREEPLCGGGEVPEGCSSGWAQNDSRSGFETLGVAQCPLLLYLMKNCYVGELS